MKKILYLSMIAFLWQLSMTAHAASCVSVKQVSANYTNKTVTFVLSWSGCNGINHLNTVWCLVDWRTVDASGKKGNWTRATIDTPTVTGASLGSVKTDGFWITGNSSATVTVKLGNTPDMFDWCAFANDCKSTLQGSSIAGCVNSTICLGEAGFEVGFTSTRTWRVGAQTWSAPVTATYCNKTSFNGGSSGAYISDCRTNSTIAYGHLFSWCMVARFKATLCPNGWRVPTMDEFSALDKALGGSGANGQLNITLLNKYLNTWGGQYVGDFNNGSLNGQGSYANHWSQSEHNADGGNYLLFYNNGHIYPRNAYYKYTGFALRCVK